MEPVKRKQRTSYEASFKLKVVEFATANNNCAAARLFCVNEKQVREWMKIKTKLQKIPRTKKACRTGIATFSNLEEDLNDFVSQSRQNGFVVTRTAIRLRALQFSKRQKNITEETRGFLASGGWCSRFMNRHGLCFRQQTKIAQKLPKDLEEKVESFQRFVIRQRQEHGFELSQIGNMDETPMAFDLPSTRTVNTKGEKTILVRTTGNEKAHFTVVLACLADGSKLPPVIIFKRKTLPKSMKFPAGILVRAHHKGWMDERGTIDWLENVWGNRPGGLEKKPSLLVWDMFSAHKTEEVKRSAKEQAVIPRGLTSVLQPLDVCLNKPFKDRIRKMWSEWMISGEGKLTKGGNLKRPEIDLVAQWVKDAWDSIPAEMVQKSFRKCSISNALDGTQDDEAFTDDE